MQSDTADNVAWAKYAMPRGVQGDAKSTHSASSSSSANSAIDFKTLSTPIPLHAAIQEASDAILSTRSKLIIVTGRSRRLAVENHRRELKQLMEEHEHVSAEVRKTIGDVATAFVVAGVGSGIVVLQASGAGHLD